MLLKLSGALIKWIQYIAMVSLATLNGQYLN